MRLLFFGTPQFAVPTLRELVTAGHDVCRVISQPARPVGRGRKLQDPPVAIWARQHGLEVLQPSKIRRKDFLDGLRALEPDIAVVVAYGRIFRRSLLELPRLGCVNLHASLLPRHRGAAPIQAAIASGDPITGVTTMRMSEGLDSGPILLTAELEIGGEETTPELAERLSERGAQLIVETLAGLDAGTLGATGQPEDGITYAPRIEKSAGRIDWTQSATTIFNRLRAFTPWPGASGEFRGGVLKVQWARPFEQTTDEAPGAILGLEDEAVLVACGGGTVLGLEKVQRPGKKAVGARDLWNGERWQAGERFADGSVEPTGTAP